MSVGITLAKALKTFSSEIGCGGEDSRENLIDRIQEALEFLLFNGGGNILREWKLTVRKGRFTLPLDLETPIKYKIGRTANEGYGTFNSPYYSYGSQSISSCCGYYEWEQLRAEIKANKVATQFHPPEKGIQVVATTKDCRDVGKKIMVNGKRCKMQILPTHNGYKTAGELLTIYHEEDPDKKYSSYIFDEITSVEKDLTCDYVMLSGIDQCCNTWYFLSHYTPDETVPQYTEAEILGCGCAGSCDFELCVLGRVQSGIRYIRDEDILPISSVSILRLLAKRARYDDSGDFNELAAIETRIRVEIKKQIAYQQPANRQLSYSLGTTGATLSNF